ncbi:hypothetical protein K438DRAFT_759079 [Mycena galopus ATCC 62051]|nr:hypothetical protein K438DRAFT_759079 [Mycena galopus ATCC 62051]
MWISIHLPVCVCESESMIVPLCFWACFFVCAGWSRCVELCGAGVKCLLGSPLPFSCTCLDSFFPFLLLFSSSSPSTPPPLLIASELTLFSSADDLPPRPALLPTTLPSLPPHAPHFIHLRRRVDVPQRGAAPDVHGGDAATPCHNSCSWQGAASGRWCRRSAAQLAIPHASSSNGYGYIAYNKFG